MRGELAPELPADVRAPRVLHVNDCAFTATLLIARAHELGLPWSFQPVAAQGKTWPGVSGQMRKAALGARWLAVLAARSARVDLLHVHSGSVLRHSRLVPKPYVLHLHGTDIRTLQYDPAWTAVIRSGVQRARHVFYATPDLAEHTLPLRPDATYLPVPIDTQSLPVWAADDQRPVVAFASRWDDNKGVQSQLDLARRLVSVLGESADVVGLDWGAGAEQARAAGVRVRPKAAHPEYLQWLSTASVVIGQSTGALGASELEAMGTGAPLVVPVPLPLYDDIGSPVLGASVDSAVEAVLALLDGSTGHDAAASRAWVHEHHSVQRATDTVAAVYRDLLPG